MTKQNGWAVTMAPRFTPSHLNKGESGFYEIELSNGTERKIVKGSTPEECWAQANEITGAAEAKPATNHTGASNVSSPSATGKAGSPAADHNSEG